MRRFIPILAALLITGCSSVVMQGPFPDSTLTAEERRELQGIWQLDSAVIYLNFTTNGLPVMSSVEWIGGRHMLIEHDLHIIRQNDSYYLSLQPEPGEEPVQHLFAAFKPRQREIVVWAPDVEFFEDQISAGRLKGTVRKEGRESEIRLTSPPEQILSLIATNPAAMDYEEPLVFRKLD
jgi:hypothetical protein